MPRSFPANASATTNRWYVRNAAATRKVKAGAFRSTSPVSGSAIAMNAPVRSTTKIGMRIMRIPRTHRPWYIWPRPGKSPDSMAAKPGEVFAIGARSVRTRGVLN